MYHYLLVMTIDEALNLTSIYDSPIVSKLRINRLSIRSLISPFKARYITALVPCTRALHA